MRTSLVGLCGFLAFWIGEGLSFAAATAPPPPDLTGEELTLETAIDLALRHNPRLKGWAAAESQAQAESRQAGRGPNPELALDMENVAGSGQFSGFSAAEYTLVLSQTFELGHKRSRQRDAATWNTERVRLDARLAALAVKSRVTRAFIQTHAAQEALALDVDLVQLAEQDLEFVKRQVRKGAASPVETNRAQVAVYSARLEFDAAEQTLATARVRLTNLWNAAVPTFDNVKGCEDPLAPPLPWDELSRQLDRSPQLKQWDVEAGQRRATAALAEAMGKIDLTAAAGIRHFTDIGENAMVVSVAVPLPVRDTNRDSRDAARFGLDQLDAERQTQLMNLRESLARQHRELAVAYDQIVAIREDILPAAEQSLAQMDVAYRKGLFNLTDVLAVRRTWFELRRNYTEACARYRIAAVEIEQIVGDLPAMDFESREDD